MRGLRILHDDWPGIWGARPFPVEGDDEADFRQARLLAQKT
jgi:hypothetical protein